MPPPMTTAARALEALCCEVHDWDVFSSSSLPRSFGSAVYVQDLFFIDCMIEYWPIIV
jgi:hypothetical protein